MRFEDERYVRLFTRDTATWKLLPWQSKALLPLLLRKLDRAGLADVGDEGLEGVAALIDMPLELVEAGMPALLKRGVFTLVGGRLLMPNFLVAQEAKASDKLRAKEHRERVRARELPDPPGSTVTQRDATVTNRDDPSRCVTNRHAESHGVTGRHTPSLCAEPIRTSPPNPLAGAEGEEGGDAEAPRLPTQESAQPTAAKLEWAQVEDTLCRASRGTIAPAGGAQMVAKFMRLLAELRCTLADVDALGRFCAARPPTFPRWASQHPTLTLGHLLTERIAEGSGLTDLVGLAKDWAKAQAAKPSPPIDPKGPRVVPGAARTDAEAAESARLLAEGAFARGPKLRAVEPAPRAKAVGE